MLLKSIFIKRLLSAFLLVTISSISIVYTNSFLSAQSIALVAISTDLNTKQLMVDGEIIKAISILENNLAQSKKDKNRLQEAKILNQLQFAYYCQGELRRSLIVGQDLSEVLRNLFNGNIADSQIISMIVDNIVLYMHTEVERGETEKLNERVDELLQYQKLASDSKTKAKFSLGLASAYNLSRKEDQFNASFKEFTDFNIDISKLQTSENLQFIFAYINTIKLLKDKKTTYLDGVKIISNVKQLYDNQNSIIVKYAELNIASLYHTGEQYDKSSSLLVNNYQKIDLLPTLFQFLTLDILGDNAYVEKKYLEAKKYYSLLENILLKPVKRGADTHARLLRAVVVKIARTNSLLGRVFSKEDIQTIVYQSSGNSEVDSSKDVQNRIDKLAGDSIAIQSSLIEKKLIWDALVVSELTRNQLTKRQLNIKFDLVFDGLENESFHMLSLEVAGKESLFPKAALNLASSFQFQNMVDFNDGYQDPRHIVRTSKSTIIEYAYDLTNNYPKEIYAYILRPEVDMRKMRPIVRCINLDPSSITPICKANSSGKILSSLNTELINISKLGLNNFLTQNLLNVINCRTGKSTHQDKCSSRTILNTSKTYKSLQLLHRLLIEPIIDLLPTDPSEKVIFIPQGQLFSIPFAALQDKNGKYLIENHTTSIAPSLSLLGKARDLYVDKSRSKAKKILVVGNPTMGLPLSSLPFAETEAKTIAQIYGVKPLIGDEATKEAVLKDFSESRIVHLATHGIISDNNSRDSIIALAPTTANKQGKLLARDIPPNMAELVILSICKSGKGEISTDGIAGFSTELILSGTPSQVVSLWRVNDKSTSEIMIDFHLGLRKGESKTHALHEAMLKAMKSDNHIDPYYWAPFILSGNTQ
jgi:CHAT domain-containing protein